MKTKITSLVLALLVICSLFTMTACNDKTETQTTEPQASTMTLVVGSKSNTIYIVELDKVETDKGIMPILEHLKKEKGLEYKSEDSGYGAFLTKVGDLVQRDKTYIYLYTSVEKDRDVSEYSRVVNFEGKILYSSGVGASEMTIEPGCTIYIGMVNM